LREPDAIALLNREIAPAATKKRAAHGKTHNFPG
jgi:hypothetical protein